MLLINLLTDSHVLLTHPFPSTDDSVSLPLNSGTFATVRVAKITWCDPYYLGCKSWEVLDK